MIEKPLLYEGNEPYIFISYAHKDVDRVWPIIQDLNENGYRVWYDDGITPGTEWAKIISEHIYNSAYFIGFISKDYLESENCRDELSFARDKKIKRLLCYIEQVQLPMEMEMRMARLQNIPYYQYKDKKEFLKKMFSAEGIEQCKIEDSIHDVADIHDGQRTDGNSAKTAENKEAKKNRKNMFIGMMSFFLILLIAGGIYAKQYFDVTSYEFMDYYSDFEKYERIDDNVLGSKVYVFGNKELRRDQIQSITFVNSLKDAPKTSWDVTRARKGKVKAWVIPDGELYHLYIGSNQKIIFKRAFLLFACFENAENIILNDCIDWSEVTSMSDMFSRCRSLKTIDISSINAKQLDQMSSAFRECNSLYSVIFGNLKTEKVVDMMAMFYNCRNLKELHFGENFTTSSVASMHWMFGGCTNLVKIEGLDHFDTSKVTQMRNMFYDCSNLTELDLRSFTFRDDVNVEQFFLNTAWQGQKPESKLYTRE